MTTGLVLSTGVNSHTVGPGAYRDAMTAAGRWREIAQLQQRSIDAPALTVDSKSVRTWRIHPPLTGEV